MKRQRSAQRAGGHGPQGRRHERFQLLAGRASVSGFQVDIAAAIRSEKWRKHGKADDVVHMGMGNEQSKPGLGQRLGQTLPQKARPGIQKNRLISRLIQHAAGLPAKDGAGGAVHGHRPAHAQQPDANAVHPRILLSGRQLEDTLVRFRWSMRLRAMRLTARESTAPVTQETAQAVQLGKRR